MPKWTKETAVEELNKFIEEIELLKKVIRLSTDHVRWLAKLVPFVDEVFGMASIYSVSIKSLDWQKQGPFQVHPLDPELYWANNINTVIERRHQRAYVEQLDIAKGLLQAAKEQLERFGIEGVYQGKDTPPEASAIVKVINLAEHKLRKIVRVAPQKEKEIQDCFENLLIGAEVPYSRESEHIEYSTKTYIPDFTISNLNLAIEIKLCSHNKREREMIDEINADIVGYKTKYGNLLFVIYDVGIIRDVDRFISHFEKNENVIIRIIKH